MPYEYTPWAEPQVGPPGQPSSGPHIGWEPTVGADTSNRPDWAGSGPPPGEQGGPGYIEPVVVPPVDTSGDSGFTSDTTTNPYYTTEGTFIPEQRPIQAPSDLMVGNVIADALANQTVNPGYALSWDYNPDNPNNLGTYTGDVSQNEGVFQSGVNPTLGSIMSVDSSGNPILDSSGNPILTNFGTQIVGDVQQNLAQQGPVDLSLYGAQGPTGFWDNIMSPAELRDYQDSFWRDYTAPGGGGGYEDYGGWDYGDRRDAKMQFLAALAAGAPSRGMEQSGFFDTLVDPYAEEQQQALQGGIFSGMYGQPGQTGISGEGMKRMLRSYGSGLQSPRYANVAKGGIVGLLGV